MILGVWKGFKIVSYTMFSLILLYIVIAFLLSVIPMNRNTSLESEKTETIYLLSNGIHLDFIFKREALETFQEELDIKSRHEYIAMGWGDEGFYLKTKTWDDLEFRTVFNALFMKSEAAMHLTRYQRLSEKAIKLEITKAQLEILIEHCISSFEKSSANQFMKIPNAAYFNNDNFYKANGSYNCIKTCNEWVNIGLKKAGIKTSIWSPLDKGIIYQLEK